MTNDLENLSLNNALDVICKAFADVQKIYPDYSPIAPHVKRTARADASTFNADLESVEDVVERLKEFGASIKDLQINGSGEPIILAFQAKRPIGETKLSQPAGETFTVVQTDHGLKVRGHAVIRVEPTEIVTAVLTDEGQNNYVLATLYPGMLEDLPNMDGLTEGDQLTQSDLQDRKIIRVIPE